MDTPNVLHPRWRQKLPKQLSYPVGAELLSRELGTHPELPKLELHFSASPIASRSEFRQMLENKLPYVVLRVQFVRWDKRLSYGDDQWIQEYLRGKWTVDVFPVLRSLKSQAKEMLISKALPQVAAWMTKPREPAWYYGRKEFAVVFQPEEADLEFREREMSH